jgi:hypothetical protein
VLPTAHTDTHAPQVGATKYSCVNADGGWAESQPLSPGDYDALDDKPPSDDPRWVEKKIHRCK